MTKEEKLVKWQRIRFGYTWDLYIEILARLIIWIMLTIAVAFSTGGLFTGKIIIILGYHLLLFSWVTKPLWANIKKVEYYEENTYQPPLKERNKSS